MGWPERVKPDRNYFFLQVFALRNIDTMCRIAAYYGPPVRLSSLVLEGSHSLTHQSRSAREMEDGSVAGDGWGVGWFSPGPDAKPGIMKSILPLWSDENAKLATPCIESGSIVGHVRFASPGIETCFINTPLFILEERLFTHNGGLMPWPSPLGKAIRDRLDPDHEADVRGATDSELLGALWRTHFRRTGGQDAAEALRTTLKVARDLAMAHDGGQIKASIILADGSGLVAARFADPGPPPTLYLLEDEPRGAGGVVLASEPIDDGPGWREVEPSTLVRCGPGGVHLEALGLEKADGRPRRRMPA